MRKTKGFYIFLFVNLHVRFEIVDPAEIPTDVFYAISDANMTRVISGILGFELTNKSDSACISDDYDVLYLVKYHGQKLEEGTTSLPKGTPFSCKSTCLA